MYSGSLVKKDNKFVYTDAQQKILYQIFLDKIKDGEEVEIFICKKGPKATGAQITKIHTCIRMIAQELGYDFEDVKLLVKEKAGLCMIINQDDSQEVKCKSFADCSSIEISLAIEACKDIAERNNIILE